MVTDPSQGVIQPVQITCPRQNDATPLYPPGSNGVNPPVGLPSKNGGAGAGFSDKECDGTYSPMRMDLFFPSCYKEGVPVDDQKNSMVWPTGDKCPAGTRKVPKLFYEIYWSTMDFHGKWTPGQGKSPWVLSNGDPTGYGMHGDFVSWLFIPSRNMLTVFVDCWMGRSGSVVDHCQLRPQPHEGCRWPTQLCRQWHDEV